MAFTIRDVQQAQNALLQTREPNRSVTSGRLVSVNGIVTPPGRPNYVYFLEFNQPENAPPAVVWNDVVAPIADLPVLVASDPKPPFRRKVIGINHEVFPPNLADTGGLFNIPPHAQSHQYPNETNPGHDPVLIYQPAIQPLKCTPFSGMTVNVQPLIYIFNRRRYTFGGGIYDLTAHIPNVNNIRAVLIYLDVGTNNLAVIAGPSVIDNGVIPIPYPEIPINTIPSAYVLLVGNATTISNTAVIDARFLLWGNFDHTTFNPRRIGDILISNDGLIFEPGETLIDSAGALIMDNRGHIVVI